ncbi:TRAP transporter fused permease subunit [Salinadaptatus halalkaliphilus]|uniref:TRAP transporter fused permease subunit n=1 Tax=Salinadaptatus halalkaliphilus TaxID=2419781 RepID=A0A4S3TNV1_9EURY|nr:TRAP transporter fused permease subunit [Salinadaptatus halalkaliphilus]THE65999.1 TRAP transporter fused permease subunit [Salinadaptatus halalkaliphilus]
MNFQVHNVTAAARDGRSWLRAAIYLFGVALTLFTIYYAYAVPIERTRYSNIFLGIGLALFYLLEVQKRYDPDGADDPVEETDIPDRPGFGSVTGRASAFAALTGSYRRLKRGVGTIDPVVALLFAFASLAATGYVEYHFQHLQYDAQLYGFSTADHIVGLTIIVLVTDATRRAFGNLITSVVVLAVAYAFVGPWLPGIFQHTGMSWEEAARHGAIGLTGTYGFILAIGSTWVAIFIMFAGMAKAFGALEYVLDIGREMGTSLHTGVVQIAVIASMIMGSITGSAAANTATTGSFTIPMIKEQGIREDFAAAIEAVASSGGQMLPPVMGVAAFLMADIIGVPYVMIIQAGIIPAALFYFSVGVAVYLITVKFGWTTDETTSFNWRVFLKGLHFVIPLAVLLYTLIVLRFTPLAAGMYTIFTMVPVIYLRNLYVDGISVGTLVDTTVDTFDGLRQGAVEMAPLVGILGSLGVILVFVTQTGLSQQISLQMVALAGGVLILLLLMAMIASILFGLGMPTPAAYILVVMLVVPGVTSMGIPDITAHMFVFYFAMLSAITPPVAVAVAIGSSIAGASFLKSCVQALRIGAPGFLIPFAFIANNSLIYWSFPETVIAFPLVLLGTASLVVATVGYDGVNELGYGHRAFYMALTFGALFGPLVVQAGAGALILLSAFLANTDRLPAIVDPAQN